MKLARLYCVELGRKCTISSSDREMGTTKMPLLLAPSTRKPVTPLLL
jgi:hypothetical protein